MKVEEADLSPQASLQHVDADGYVGNTHKTLYSTINPLRTTAIDPTLLFCGLYVFIS